MSTFDSPSPNLSTFAPGDTGEHKSHTVQFYADDAFLMDDMSRFLGTALGRGDSAIVICTRAHREGLSQRLKVRWPEISRAIDTGRYVQLDAAQTLAQFMVDDCPDAQRFADFMGPVISRAQAVAESDPARVAAFGEMVTLLWAQGKSDAAVRLEELWNALSRTHSFSLRCSYPMAGFSRQEDGGPFARICAQHSAVIPDESYTTLIAEDERMHTVARLQQKARALQAEMEERGRVENKLRRSAAELELLVEQRTAALQRLSSRLLRVLDGERRRLARELHDTIGQHLIALKLNVNVLRKSPEREDLWVGAEQLMKQCISEVRTLSYLLHPPTLDEIGFASAANWYVKGFIERSGLRVSLNVSEGLTRMPPEVELSLFRTLQETLNNVHWHSGASKADVMVARSAHDVTLEVKDNGHGIPQQLVLQILDTGGPSGVGLMSMRERARELGGTMQLQSDQNGTSVRIRIPITPGSERVQL
jgi:signal transduction histidine kinase